MLLQLQNQLKRDKTPKPQIVTQLPNKHLKTDLGEKNIEEATRFIQDIITDPKVWNPDQMAENQRLFDATQSGNWEATKIAKEKIEMLLKEYRIKVEGYTTEQAAQKIYATNWGLDVLEEYYWDSQVDEIRINSPTQIFIQRRGKNEKVNISLKDEEHVKNILSRLFIHDRGVALTSSTPVVESMRLDGTRVTATCPPATKNCTLVLRKHGTFEMTRNNLIRAQTADDKIMDLLETLVSGRTNILISGGTGTGKTTLLRYLAGYLNPSLRIVTLETDREIRLGATYPERDVVEMEEHKELGFTLSEAFRTILRYSPDIIIVGEIRGKGEAIEAIKACVRGHDGSMATVHFGSPYEAIEGCGKMMLEEGLNLSLEIANLWVADAFQVVIQMFADTTKGIKKITHITEVYTEKGEINFSDLAVWRPKDKNYFEGEWIFPNKISPQLRKRMAKYTSWTGEGELICMTSTESKA
jgi:pilus assembly protein CpaF